MLILSFEVFRLSFGPQHPASHGVLVCVLYMVNEYIVFCDTQIGYLHRGTEKLIEFKSVSQVLPYFDRLDYVAILHNEHICVLAFELLLRISLTVRVSLLRVLVLEISRILNHLLGISCGILDLGSISPLL